MPHIVKDQVGRGKEGGEGGWSVRRAPDLEHLFVAQPVKLRYFAPMIVHGFVDQKHVKKEKEKARKLRQSQWWKQQLAQGVCYYCEQAFSREELTMDHKTPISRGGTSSKGNVVACCKPCNSEKKYLTPAEMILQNSPAQ